MTIKDNTCINELPEQRETEDKWNKLRELIKQKILLEREINNGRFKN